MNIDKEIGEIWPAIFSNPDLIETRHEMALCADGLSAWGSCMAGCLPPKSFGDVLVRIGEKLKMEKAATAENLRDHAYSKGWLKR